MIREILLIGLAVAGWGGLVGCAGREKIDVVPVTSTTGQVRVQNGRSAVIFDAVFAKSAGGDVALDLRKGGPSPVASLRLSKDGRASFSGFGRKWSGFRSDAPPLIAPLFTLAFLYSTEATIPDGAREVMAPNMRVAVDAEGGHLKSAGVASVDGPFAALARFSAPKPKGGESGPVHQAD
ncbi:MAG: hypothetical protein Fur0032_02810 [Terrimicrobiaceae bacterium]